MQVTRAFDGEEAYQTILERGGPDAFDVILMDLHMPRKVLTLIRMIFGQSLLWLTRYDPRID